MPSLSPIFTPSDRRLDLHAGALARDARADRAAPVLADRGRRQARGQLAPPQHDVAERVAVRARIEHVVGAAISSSRSGPTPRCTRPRARASAPRHTLWRIGSHVRRVLAERIGLGRRRRRPRRPATRPRPCLRTANHGWRAMPSIGCDQRPGQQRDRGLRRSAASRASASPRCSRSARAAIDHASRIIHQTLRRPSACAHSLARRK